ncbi:sugar phosphate isomerase/epimerase [Paenibacillus sp. N4]|uniref:sugar phosphate isomerase/epimerase family protein n=1 Tax=Paenibacillus vietnamensis TaxID=2590547 RepID=UPI001CD12E61|nr:sugar phosphate isomerase/epimerase [Paenibacillus vietnamensis]MCA0753519.1 sugar phosphate isomerase/epimerase [Paenibacillus vietnamensis]
MSVKFAFSRPTQSDEERDLLFRGYRSAGYEGLQLKHGQYAPYIGEPERFLEEWGMLPGAASALIAGGVVDEESRARLDPLLAFAERIGAERIVFCHGLSRKHVTADDIRRFSGLLSELGKETQQRGIQLSLHHHYDQPVMYREDFDIFFDRLPERTVGLTVDTAHLVKSGITDIAEIVTGFAPYIDNFHMKDFADGEWRVLGEGGIDFEPVFRAMNTIRYDGWVSADEESGGGIQEGMRQCFDFMKQGLQEARDKAGRR